MRAALWHLFFLLAAPAGVNGGEAARPSLPTVRLPDPRQLVRAVRSDDDVEIERVAGRLGAGRLQALTVPRSASASSTREVRMAALRALGLVDDGWVVLPDLIMLLHDPDADVAEASARAMNRIVGGLTPERVSQSEVPPDIPRRSVRLLSDAAARRALRPSLRVAAINALAGLRAIVRLDDAELEKLLGDGEPQVRRAAVEALAEIPRATPSLLLVVESDPSPEVAAAAGAALCRDLPAVGQNGPAVERGHMLSTQLHGRLRALAFDTRAPLVYRMDLLGCLRLSGDPADVKALDVLAHRPPESLRRRARSLGGR